MSFSSYWMNGARSRILPYDFGFFRMLFLTFPASVRIIRSYGSVAGNASGTHIFFVSGGLHMEDEETIASVKKNILTYAGLKKLEDELNDLKVNQRKAISEKIKEAREQGDLSENAEYDAAKDEQRDIEARIEEIEKILKNAEVVVEDEASTKAIQVGCRVKVLDMTYDEEMDFAIVGSTEANSLEGKISNESPVGRALIGAKKGQVVTVSMPSGDAKFKVLKITRNV